LNLAQTSSVLERAIVPLNCALSIREKFGDFYGDFYEDFCGIALYNPSIT
jgi:hypothetical protein